MICGKTNLVYTDAIVKVSAQFVAGAIRQAGDSNQAELLWRREGSIQVEYTVYGERGMFFLSVSRDLSPHVVMCRR